MVFIIGVWKFVVKQKREIANKKRKTALIWEWKPNSVVSLCKVAIDQ